MSCPLYKIFSVLERACAEVTSVSNEPVVGEMQTSVSDEPMNRSLEQEGGSWLTYFGMMVNTRKQLYLLHHSLVLSSVSLPLSAVLVVRARQQ